MKRASDKCLREKRKTINGDDIISALSDLGFEKFIDPLKLYLKRLRDNSKSDIYGDEEKTIINDYSGINSSDRAVLMQDQMQNENLEHLMMIPDNTFNFPDFGSLK